MDFEHGVMYCLDNIPLGSLLKGFWLQRSSLWPNTSIERLRRSAFHLGIIRHRNSAAASVEG